MSEQELERNLWMLLRVLVKKSGLLMLASLLGVCAAVGGTALLVTPQYESTVTLYVNETLSARDLADSFDVIVKMRESLMEVIRETGIRSNHTQLQKRIHVSSVKQTDFLQITVTAPDPYEAELIADVIGRILPQQVSEIMEGTSVKVVGEAIAPEDPSSPSYPSAAVLGAVIGLLLMVSWITLEELLLKREKHRP